LGLVLLTEGLDVFIPRTADIGGKEAQFSNDSVSKFSKLTTKVYCKYLFTVAGRESSVGIATRYGMDGPGIESRWGARFSAPVQTDSEAHTASYTMGTVSFQGVKWPGRGDDHPPHLAPRLKKV
jgi:hypothetical protein